MRIVVLGHYPFEAFALGDAIGGETILRQTARDDELLRRLRQHGFQFIAAPRQRFRSKVSTVTIEAIEDCVVL